jgi:integrase
MPRKTEVTMTERRVAALPVGRHSVGGAEGLRLQVTPTSKTWTFRYRVGGKQREAGLGPLATGDKRAVAARGRGDALTLKEARAKAVALRALVLDGRDPLNEARHSKGSTTASPSSDRTFGRAAELVIEARAEKWTNTKSAAQWRSSLNTHAKALMTMHVNAITKSDVLDVLRPIWKSHTETASRVRQRIEVVMSYAIFLEWRTASNPATWKGGLVHALADPRKVTPVTHHAAVNFEHMPALVTKLRGIDTVPARALELLIYTAARSREVRGAVWSEFDLDARLWTIPAMRMKARTKHIVPLSKPAIALLKSLPDGDADTLLFLSPVGKELWDVPLAKVLKKLAPSVTVHGLRSSFRRWAVTTSHSFEAAEVALAHQLGNATSRAYVRGDPLIEQRVPLMEDWGRFLAAPARSATVSPIRFAHKRASR